MNHNSRNEAKYLIRAQIICSHLWRHYGRCKGVPKLLKSLKKPKKAPKNTMIEKMCDFYHKPWHLKECCHWNPKNPNNKLKDIKEVLVNKVSPQARKWTSGNHRKQGNQNQRSSLVYSLVEINQNVTTFITTCDL